MSTKVRATVEDLYNVPENRKAEIIDGELAQFMPSGMKPSRASGNIYLSLRGHEGQTRERSRTSGHLSSR